jgi:hypothetical protein
LTYRNWITFALILASCLVSPVRLSAQEAWNAEVGRDMTIGLVPAEYFDLPDEVLVTKKLPSGLVYLYREGSYEPEIVAQANVPQYIPPGTWFYIAEADRYVSAKSGALVIPEGEPRQARAMVTPVVPACRLHLSEDVRWRGLERLDVVSIDAQAVYPVIPSKRPQLAVPAGRFLAYGVRGGALTGISAVQSCLAGAAAKLEPPSAPAPDRQSLLVRFESAAELSAERREGLVAELVSTVAAEGRAVATPAAVLWYERFGAAFFIDVPAVEDLDVTISAAALRTSVTRVPTLGGSAREVDVGRLAARRGLELSLLYLPARPHRAARVELQRCGRDRAVDMAMTLRARCGEPLAVLDLVPGVASYQFSSLDDGQYLISARVDDEDVAGLGADLMPYLDPENNDGLTLAPVRLEEMQISGRLRRGGEDLAGEVRILPWGGATGVAREFATREDGEFTIYYFGQLPAPGQVELFSEELRGRAPGELLGYYCCYQVSACEHERACETFNVHSVFTGSGRWDVELSDGQPIDIQVFEAGSGRPVAGASVLVPGGPAFHYYDGGIHWVDPDGVEGESLLTDSQGSVRWLPHTARPQTIVAFKDGYEDASVRVEPPTPDAPRPARLELRRRGYSGGVQFLLPGGVHPAGARLIAYDDDGARDRACAVELDGEGRAPVPAPGCSKERSFLFLHPAAAMQVLAASAWATATEFEVAPRPRAPIRIRLRDRAGNKVTPAAVQLRLGSVVVTPNDLTAVGDGAPRLIVDENGELVLSGLDPDGGESIEVAPWGTAGEADWTPITRDDTGRWVELTVRPPEPP